MFRWACLVSKCLSLICNTFGTLFVHEYNLTDDKKKKRGT